MSEVIVSQMSVGALLAKIKNGEIDCDDLDPILRDLQDKKIDIRRAMEDLRVLLSSKN